MSSLVWSLTLGSAVINHSALNTQLLCIFYCNSVTLIDGFPAFLCYSWVGYNSGKYALLYIFKRLYLRLPGVSVRIVLHYGCGIVTSYQEHSTTSLNSPSVSVSQGHVLNI